MSQVPVTPPEMSSREDTPPESLLERLRKITGLTEAELPPVTPPKPERREPPVDGLLTALREVTGVAAACGIAVAVTLATLAAGLARGAGMVARNVRQRHRQRLESRRIAPGTLPPAALPPQPCVSHEASFVEEAPPPPAAVAPPVTAGLEEKQEEETGANSGMLPATQDLLPEPARPAAPVRRRIRGAFLTGLALCCLLPALLLIPPVRYQVSSLLGWGNALVVAGEGGWLFPRATSRSAVSLHETAARLQAGGATLIVVNVPAKAAIYPERLDASHGGGLERDSAVAATQQQLATAGARLLDLGPVLHALKAGEAGREPAFRAQSSHWSPAGAERAAAAVAAFVQQQSGYAALPLSPQQPALTRHSLTAPLEDLAAAFDSPRWREAHPPQPLHFIRLLGADHQPLAPDAASPVVLLGGDEVRIYDDPALTPSVESPPDGGRFSAGFAQYLTLYLSTALDVHTAESASAAATNWLDMRPEPDRGTKKFIIWVVPDAEMVP